MTDPTRSFRTVRADLARTDHGQAVADLVDAYAADPLGNGARLDASVKQALIPALQAHPTTEILLAFCDERAVGVAVCFVGFSTFAARPLLNLHDLAVLPEFRGQGVGRLLLAAVERRAVELGCCKVTLEVFAANPARRLYEACGFRQVEHGPGEAGAALFLAKSV